MNYTFIKRLAGYDDITIGYVYREPWERPTVGQTIEIKGVLYRVDSCSPTSNPDNATVTYYVSEFNANRPFRRKI